ncbi:hypothetical protein OTERR_20160 [Oryzomicrobium terrae]|uniref:Leucine-binding protein domain-containing protein n=1 Tax=Oryzomicrobium terrae TaxID=1735038 RepID=A0A5C1E9B4_9RHOO|nr:ABC transporter substrate-binding protein [Oryzomicrobium terrae]QEL65492.1 hypothetical protein OTERR_20160 [Oryzomicrobium terrae]
MSPLFQRLWRHCRFALPRRQVIPMVALATLAGLPQAWSAPPTLSPPTAGDLVIGQVAPLSGVLASTGEQMVLGVKLQVELTNARGGINGRRVRQVVADDGYRVEDTVAQTRQLLQRDKPLALIGFAGTANVAELLKQGILAEARMPLVAPYTGGEPLRSPFNPFVFHIRASYADEAEYMVDQLTAMGITRIAVFYQDDAFGRSVLAGVEATLKRRKLDLAAAAGYERNTARVDEAVAKLRAADPGTIVMVATNKPAAAFAKAYRAAGGAAQLLNLSVVDPAELVKLAGLDSVHGLGITQVVPSPDSMLPVAREYREALKRYAPGIAPSYAGFEEFIGAKVLFEAIHRAGANPTPERVLQSLEALGTYDAGGHPLRFSPGNRVGSRFVEVTLIGRGGRLMR